MSDDLHLHALVRVIVAGLLQDLSDKSRDVILSNCPCIEIKVVFFIVFCVLQHNRWCKRVFILFVLVVIIIEIGVDCSSLAADPDVVACVEELLRN